MVDGWNQDERRGVRGSRGARGEKWRKCVADAVPHGDLGRQDAVAKSLICSSVVLEKDHPIRVAKLNLGNGFL
jgi:hypothetical protein